MNSSAMKRVINKIRIDTRLREKGEKSKRKRKDKSSRMKREEKERERWTEINALKPTATALASEYPKQTQI